MPADDPANDDSVPVLIAPGGWCAPTTYEFSFHDVDPALVRSPDNPFHGLFNDVVITRGGIRYPVGPVRRYRWYARSRWGWRLKRVLFGVQWVDQ